MQIKPMFRHFDKEKNRAWKAFMLTGGEDQFTSEIKLVMSRIDELTASSAELQKKLELIFEAEVDIEEKCVGSVENTRNGGKQAGHN